MTQEHIPAVNGRHGTWTPAPLWRRVAAFTADILLAGLLSLPASVLLDALGPELDSDFSYRVTQLIGAALFVIYSIMMTLTMGSTMGKGLLRLTVIDAAHGTRLTDVQLGRRSAVLGLSIVACQVVLPMFAPPILVVPALMALVSPAFLRPDRRAFHDLIAGTMVISEPPIQEDH